jgi:uncharacterized membrane protein
MYMKKQTTLGIILLIAIFGACFSGYLSYNELVKNVCVLGGSCPSVFNLPACVYGLVMYIIVGIIAILGLTSKDI